MSGRSAYPWIMMKQSKVALLEKGKQMPVERRGFGGAENAAEVCKTVGAGCAAGMCNAAGAGSAARMCNAAGAGKLA